MQAAAEGAFREAIGKAPLEAILVADRRDLEAEIRHRAGDRLKSAGIAVDVERARIVDAHPPRDVVPAYRDVAAAVSDAERYRNEALGYAESRRWLAEGEARETRDRAAATSHELERLATGDRDAFVARSSGPRRPPRPDRLPPAPRDDGRQPRRPLQADPRPPRPGRRQIWLADPDRFGISPTAAIGSQAA